jgi:hypothetical protein
MDQTGDCVLAGDDVDAKAPVSRGFGRNRADAGDARGGEELGRRGPEPGEPVAEVVDRAARREGDGVDAARLELPEEGGERLKVTASTRRASSSRRREASASGGGDRVS